METAEMGRYVSVILAALVVAGWSGPKETPPASAHPAPVSFITLNDRARSTIDLFFIASLQAAEARVIRVRFKNNRLVDYRYDTAAAARSDHGRLLEEVSRLGPPPPPPASPVPPRRSALEVFIHPPRGRITIPELGIERRETEGSLKLESLEPGFYQVTVSSPEGVAAGRSLVLPGRTTEFGVNVLNQTATDAWSPAEAGEAVRWVAGNLSGREAFDYLLELEESGILDSDCPRCGGTGQCGKCQGEGQTSRFGCSACGSRGSVTVDCSQCGGKGWVGTYQRASACRRCSEWFERRGSGKQTRSCSTCRGAGARHETKIDCADCRTSGDCPDCGGEKVSRIRSYLESSSYGFELVRISEQERTRFGIGDPAFRVVSVLPFSPADRAGIVSGDIFRLSREPEAGDARPLEIDTGRGPPVTVVPGKIRSFRKE